MAIGSDLREAREQRGVSLREISERTKIRQAVLRAIENDDFQGLPGSVIMRGFLKLYAKEVGLDPDDVGRRYTAQVEASAVVAGAADAASAAGSEWPSRVPKMGAGVFVVLALIVAGYFWTRPTPVARPGSVAAPQTASEVPTAAGPSSAAKPVPPPGAPPSPPEQAAPAATAETPRATGDVSGDALRVDLQATDACWISATADGQQVAYRVLSAGERLAIRVTKEAVLRIGIPANVTVAINDKPVKPFGRPGTPTTLRITPANYRELLAQ